MKTLNKSTGKGYADNTSFEDDLDEQDIIGFTSKSPIEEEDEDFDLPLDDLDTLDNFDSDEDDDY